MNTESGREKWNSCQDHVLVDSQTAGTEKPVYACKNAQVQERMGYAVWFPPHDGQNDDKVVILSTGKDSSVQRALDQTCGPCRYYSARQKNSLIG